MFNPFRMSPRSQLRLVNYSSATNAIRVGVISGVNCVFANSKNQHFCAAHIVQSTPYTENLAPRDAMRLVWVGDVSSSAAHTTRCTNISCVCVSVFVCIVDCFAAQLRRRVHRQKYTMQAAQSRTRTRALPSVFELHTIISIMTCD